MLSRFIKEEEGQDLVEYALLLAFVGLAGAAIMISMNTPMQGIWVAMNGRLTNASSNNVS